MAVRQLHLGRFGGYLSDRMVVSEKEELLRPANSRMDWCKRIISYIWSIPSYIDENRLAVARFKEYAAARLGSQRFSRICSRYSLDFDAMEKRGSPLLSRDIAKVVIGSRDVCVADINETIGNRSFQTLDAAALASAVQNLKQSLRSCPQALSGEYEVPRIETKISGSATNWVARLFFDPFLADRERIQLCEDDPTDSFDLFVHNMAARVIKREMEVGTVLPAPNHRDGRRQFYYVSAKLLTGEGMVSYILHPANQDTDLQPIRFFRGSAFRTGEIDGVSTLITDLEKDLGRSAFESGQIYEPIIEQWLPPVQIEAGHSLGSTIVQYRLAHIDRIRKAYLYNGTGVPREMIAKFNKKMERAPYKVELVIRKSTKDLFSSLGQIHLGYRAPDNVDIDFMKFHAQKYTTSPHVSVWGRDPKSKYGIEGMNREQIDAEFYNKNNFLERIRRCIGAILSWIIRIFRDLFRYFQIWQANIQYGLQIGCIKNNLWQVLFYPSLKDITPLLRNEAAVILSSKSLKSL